MGRRAEVVSRTGPDAPTRRNGPHRLPVPN